MLSGSCVFSGFGGTILGSKAPSFDLFGGRVCVAALWLAGCCVAILALLSNTGHVLALWPLCYEVGGRVGQDRASKLSA